MRRLAPLLVGHAYHGHLLTRRLAQQHALHFPRRDILAPADDHVLDPIADFGVAIWVDHRRVATVEPAVTDRIGGGLGIVEIAGHHHVAANYDLALRLRVARHVVAFLIDDP